MFENVVITGTFDRFHKGHRHFIRSALALTTSRLTVGVSDNGLEYLKTKKLHERIQSVTWRMSVVEKFLEQEHKRSVQIQVLCNTVPFENYLVNDLDCMIFTEESANTALIVNKLREANHLSPIKAHIVEWRYKNVSSTAKRVMETQNNAQLSIIQMENCRAILERNFIRLLKSSFYPSLINTIQPILINAVEEQIDSLIKMIHHKKSEGELRLHAVIRSPDKPMLVRTLLPKLGHDGHKLLILSQILPLLLFDLLKSFSNHMSCPFKGTNRNVQNSLHQVATDNFYKHDYERFVFLLCSRAGVLVINLKVVDTVITLDSDLNHELIQLIVCVRN